jgi:hypothetical protein
MDVLHLLLQLLKGSDAAQIINQMTRFFYLDGFDQHVKIQRLKSNPLQLVHYQVQPMF